MKCAGCSRELEIGDRYITDSASGFMASFGDSASHDPALDGMLAKILGGADGKLVYCDDCTTPGGDYLFETVSEEERDG